MVPEEMETISRVQYHAQLGVQLRESYLFKKSANSTDGGLWIGTLVDNPEVSFGLNATALHVLGIAICIHCTRLNECTHDLPKVATVRGRGVYVPPFSTNRM